MAWDLGDNVDQADGRTNGDGPATANSEALDDFHVNIDNGEITDISWKRLTFEQLAYETSSKSFTISVYAKDLLDRVTWSQASTRSAVQGGGIYLAWNKGRIFAASAVVRY